MEQKPKTMSDIGESVLDSVMQIPVLSGHIIKQGLKRKNWKKRRARQIGPYLLYFDSESMQSPKGVIDLEDALICKSASLYRNQTCIEIQHPERRTLLFTVDHSEQAQEWIRSLQMGSRWYSSIKAISQVWPSVAN